MLTKGGKEILLKIVAQTILNYAMSVFLLPLKMCKEMERAMCKFWRRTSIKNNRIIHWMSWDRMCPPKSAGDLGFRHLHDFNIALVGKQECRLQAKLESLVFRVYKARYYPHSNFMSAKIGGSPNFLRRSVLEAKSIIRAGVSCRVSTGETSCILNDL